MTTIVMFHSALGRNRGMDAMAEKLTAAGHHVELPDFYDGKIFTDSSEGTAYRDSVGFPELAKRASNAIADLSGSLVFMGFSLGAAMAQSMGKRDPRAAAAILCHAGGVPKQTSWNPEVPLQIHHTVDDPWVVPGEPDRLLTSAAAAGAFGTHYVYPGESHLFADPTHEDYNAELAELMWARILHFLDHEIQRSM